jgi:hypothetical protein
VLYRVLTIDEAALISFDLTVQHVINEITCTTAGGASETFRMFGVGPNPPDPEDVRDHVKARVPVRPPVMGMSPPDVAVVNLPTWLWVNGDWAPLEDGESGERMTIRVEARPIGVVWRADDEDLTRFVDGYEERYESGGGEVSCSGPGMQWRRGLADDATDCSYTFRYPSAWDDDEVFNISATVTWEFRWWLNGVDRGVFGTIDQTSSRAVEVVEIQTVGASG